MKEETLKPEDPSVHQMSYAAECVKIRWQHAPARGMYRDRGFVFEKSGLFSCFDVDKEDVMSKKRLIFASIGLLLLFLSVFGAWMSLKSDSEFEPENSVAETDPKRSQVFVSGNDYKLDKQTKKKHQENENKRNNILDSEEAENNNNNRRDASQIISGGSEEGSPGDIPPDDPGVQSDEEDDGRERDGQEDPEDPEDATNDADKDDDEEKYYEKSEKERKLLPTIKTSLVDGQRFNGKTVSFWVSAKDYKKQNIPAGTADNGDGYFRVYINGVRTTAAGASHTGKTQYRPAVKNGKNIIKITAIDRRGRDRTITRRIYCNTKKTQEKNKTILVTITAPSIGIGVIAGELEIKTYDKEPLSEALRDAFKAAGLTGKWRGDYLVGIRKKGIAAKAGIDDDLRQKLRDLGYTVKDGKANRLFEKDFCDASGWVYTVNGYAPDSGLGSYIIDDGDEVVLRFSLYNGDVG